MGNGACRPFLPLAMTHKQRSDLPSVQATRAALAARFSLPGPSAAGNRLDLELQQQQNQLLQQRPQQQQFDGLCTVGSRLIGQSASSHFGPKFERVVIDTELFDLPTVVQLKDMMMQGVIEFKQPNGVVSPVV